MKNTILRLILRGEASQVVGDAPLHRARFVRMNTHTPAPFGARVDRDIRGQTVQQPHLRREKQAVVFDVPVPVALVGALHGERVALLTLAQRSLTGLDTPELTDKRHNRQRSEQRQTERADRDSDALLPPLAEYHRLLARHGEGKWGIAHT